MSALEDATAIALAPTGHDDAELVAARLWRLWWRLRPLSSASEARSILESSLRRLTDADDVLAAEIRRALDLLDDEVTP